MKKILFILLSSIFVFAADNLDITGNSIEDNKKEHLEKIDSEKKRILLLRSADKPIPKKVPSKTVIPRDIQKGQSMIIYSAKKNALNKAAKLNIASTEFTNCVNQSFTQESINNCFKK